MAPLQDWRGLYPPLISSWSCPITNTPPSSENISVLIFLESVTWSHWVLGVVTSPGAWLHLLPVNVHLVRVTEVVISLKIKSDETVICEHSPISFDMWPPPSWVWYVINPLISVVICQQPLHAHDMWTPHHDCYMWPSPSWVWHVNIPLMIVICEHLYPFRLICVSNFIHLSSSSQMACKSWLCTNVQGLVIKIYVLLKEMPKRLYYL